MPLRAFWMSMGLTMTPAYPRPERAMRGYGRAVHAATIAGLLADPAGKGRGLRPALSGPRARPPAGPAPPPGPLSTAPAEDAVLSAFVRDGRLVSVPAQQSKRRIVLDHLVRVFDVGVRYPEREVNALLAVWDPDTAALRRYLVDEGLLTREAGLYWRTGGWGDRDGG